MQKTSSRCWNPMIRISHLTIWIEIRKKSALEEAEEPEEKTMSVSKLTEGLLYPRSWHHDIDLHEQRAAATKQGINCKDVCFLWGDCGGEAVCASPDFGDWIIGSHVQGSCIATYIGRTLEMMIPTTFLQFKSSPPLSCHLFVTSDSL